MGQPADAATKLLNDCKLFPYNQLSGIEDMRSGTVARRVHFGTGITTWRSIDG
jgi:hypothetical protein